MVSRGARDLIPVSRSAAESDETEALVKELQETGGRHILPVSCNVADEDEFARAIQPFAAEGLPSIRGIVHAAFVSGAQATLILRRWHFKTERIIPPKVRSPAPEI